MEYAIGGYEKEGWDFTSRENSAVRRQAVSIEMLNAEAPKLICQILEGLAVKRGAAFADADGNGKIDESDMPTEKEIRSLYNSAGVNMVELLGLRLYTGGLLKVPELLPWFDCLDAFVVVRRSLLRVLQQRAARQRGQGPHAKSNGQQWRSWIDCNSR